MTKIGYNHFIGSPEYRAAYILSGMRHERARPSGKLSVQKKPSKPKIVKLARKEKTNNENTIIPREKWSKTALDRLKLLGDFLDSANNNKSNLPGIKATCKKIVGHRVDEIIDKTITRRRILTWNVVGAILNKKAESCRHQYNTYHKYPREISDLDEKGENSLLRLIATTDRKSGNINWVEIAERSQISPQKLANWVRRIKTNPEKHRSFYELEDRDIKRLLRK
jgi:hypothetical protein